MVKRSRVIELFKNSWLGLRNRLGSRKFYLLTAAAALLLILLVVALTRNRGIPVELAEATTGEIASVVNASGEIRPATEVEISSSVVGQVDRIEVAEGQRVSEGDLLLELDKEEYEAAVRRARAALQQAQASLFQSTAQWRRSRELYQSRLIARQEYETALAQYRMDQARVREAQASVDVAERQLQQTSITAPISGTVTELDVEVGEQVIVGNLNVPGTVLMVIADLSEMVVEGEIDEADVAGVALGQKVIVEVEALARRPIEGTVSEIGSAPLAPPPDDPAGAAVDYRVVVKITDTIPELKTGMTAHMDIITARKSNVLLLPVQSVVTRPVEQLEGDAGGADAGDTDADGETEAVFLYRNGVAYLVPVRTGIVGPDYIEIVEGVDDGDIVVTGPFSALREMQSGQAVRPAE